jgi:tetratricopeptide (TPR) repeat protein
MDNADDPRISLDQYFPRGDRGHVIITTRNPSHKEYGNIGPGFFRFGDLSNDDASVLLLRATTLAQPWDADSSSWARKITRQLGCLALALIHAGSAIRNGLCTLKNYLAFHDTQWEHIRRMRRESVDVDDEEKYSSIHATYEVCYNGIEEKGTQASKDAIQLLNMFSCLYHKKIRFDILTKAITNSEKERLQQEEGTQGGKGQPSDWHQRQHELRLFLQVYLTKEHGRPILPDFIREGRESETLNVARIRYALQELTQMSLITHDGSDDSYSMHPLIHEWARKRPRMSTMEQAVWLHAATTTLVHSLLLPLPPIGNTEAEELFRIKILPHVDQVRKLQEEAKNKTLKRRKGRKPGLFKLFGLLDFFWVESKFDRAQALRYAKFSMVYVQNGRLKNAEELQMAVKKSLETFLGPNHSSTRRITLALANTYRYQSRGDEAADLQEAVLNACISSLGPDHVDTLTTMDVLGQSRWQQGRFSDAKVLQQKAVNGLLKSLGPMHEDTLTAMGYLGRTLGKFYENYDNAFQLLETSYAGLKEILGPVHSKTLEVKEEIAMLTLQAGSGVTLASQMMQEVLESRKVNMGKEHPYTLFAMASMARVNIGLGRYDEAEEMLRSGLEIADRNLGEDHIGTLMGRTWLGAVLAHQSRFEESEATLLRVMNKLRHISSHRGENHPDRLSAMIQLSLCYRLQGRYNEAIQLCDQIIEGLQKISVTQHPLERKTRAEKCEMIELKAALDGGKEL